jgi:hypothetical protein
VLRISETRRQRFRGQTGRGLFGVRVPGGFGARGVWDLGCDVPTVHGVRGAGFSLEFLALKLSGVEVLEALWGAGGRVLGVEVLGPFGVLGANISGRRLSTFFWASSVESPGPRCRSPSGLLVPRLSSRGVEGSIESLVSWASLSHGVHGFHGARGAEGSSESEAPSVLDVRHFCGS